MQGMQDWMCDRSGGSSADTTETLGFAFPLTSGSKQSVLTVVGRVPLGAIDCNLGAKPV